jgi:hypothetical protein
MANFRQDKPGARLRGAAMADDKSRVRTATDERGARLQIAPAQGYRPENRGEWPASLSVRLHFRMDCRHRLAPACWYSGWPDIAREFDIRPLLYSSVEPRPSADPADPTDAAREEYAMLASHRQLLC